MGSNPRVMTLLSGGIDSPVAAWLIMKLTYDNTRTRTNQLIDGAEDVEQKSPLQLFAELYEQQNNQPMSEEQSSFTQGLIESIWEDKV